jgi:hypothetical protein
MSSTVLPTDELLRRVKGAVGKVDYSTVILMRPNQGYMSLVSLLFLPLFLLFSFLSHTFITFAGVAWLLDRSTSDSGGCSWQRGASVGSRGEEEEGCRQEAGLQENAGP